MYMECLKRSDDDPSIDCSQYRTEIEIKREGDTP